MDASQASQDLHKLSALVWDGSVPVSFTANVPGIPALTGHFLVPRMIPVHACTKPMFEKLATIEGAQFGTDKFKGWFEYRSRFNRNSFTAIIPWSAPVVVVVDWLIALEFPNADFSTKLSASALASSNSSTASAVAQQGKELLDKMFEDNALPLEFKYIDSATKPTDVELPPPPEALVQSNFLNCDKMYAQSHKQWFAALLGSTTEAVKLPPNVERALKSWDAHTFFRGRRDLTRKAGGRESTTALVAFHVVPPVTEPKQRPISMITSLRLVEMGSERLSTFGQLLKKEVFMQYGKLSSDKCMSTEPLSAELGMVRVLGLNPPLYTPLAFLRDHLCARDFALHVVVRPLPNTCISDVRMDAESIGPSIGGSLVGVQLGAPRPHLQKQQEEAAAALAAAMAARAGGGGGGGGSSSIPSALAAGREDL